MILRAIFQSCNNLFRVIVFYCTSNRGKTWSLIQHSSHKQAFIAFTRYCRKLKWDWQATWQGCLMIACQNSSCMVSSATAKRSVGGQKKRFKDTPKNTLTSVSPTGKSVPRIDPCCAVLFTQEREQLENTGSRKKRSSEFGDRNL